MSHRGRRARRGATLRAGALGGLLIAFSSAHGCGGPPAGDGEPIEFTVPSGASFAEVTDTLVARGMVGQPTLFRGYARARGADRNVRSGRYRVPRGTGWGDLLDRLTEGRVVTVELTIPEGFTLRQMVPRLAGVTGRDEAEVESRITDEDAGERFDVPGPTLEGYLFPDTYRFAPGVSLDTVLRVMVGRYHDHWTPERRERAGELELSEREVMTLASIVQAEARLDQEMPTISAVFHNRLRIGYLLQADPTVQYALEDRRSRLLYDDIDSVAEDPYNTYTQAGLPPGPIGAAGALALEAALHPADVDYLYFVARPDGSHVFTRSLEEHNRARAQSRREWDRLERDPE